MKARASIGDSPIAHALLQLIAPIMQSPLRRRFCNRVRALQAAGIQLGQQIPEVGCGTGFYTIPAAELVGDEGQVYAIDPHPLAIEQVARKVRDAGLTNVRLIKADGTRAASASATIDLVLLFGVIPAPTLPLDRLLPEMRRPLKPGRNPGGVDSSALVATFVREEGWAVPVRREGERGPQFQKGDRRLKNSTGRIGP